MDPAAFKAALATLPRHCTGCGYPLLGLPPECRCPECGVAEDGRFIVLRGAQTGQGTTVETASRGRAVFLMICSLVGLLPMSCQMLLAPPRPRSVGSMLIAAVLFATVGLQLIRAATRRFGTEGPPAQLWLGPMGFCLTAGGKPVGGKPGGKLQRVARTLVDVLTCLAVLTTLVLLAIAPWWAIFSGLFACLFGIGSYSNRIEGNRVRTAMVTPAGREEPWPVTAWGPRSQADLVCQKVGSSEFELRVEAAKLEVFGLQLRPPLRFLVQLTEAQALAVREQLYRWIMAAQNSTSDHGESQSVTPHKVEGVTP